jgi:hypothetical protein
MTNRQKLDAVHEGLQLWEDAVDRCDVSRLCGDLPLVENFHRVNKNLAVFVPVIDVR